MDSVFSNYYTKAWEQYRIFLLEDETGDELKNSWLDYMKPYMDSSGLYRLDIEEADIKQRVLITDDGGAHMKQEILDYMKYGIFDQLPDEEEAGTLLTGLNEAAAVKTLSESYGKHTKDAVRLEHKIEEINDSLEKQRRIWEEADSALDCYDGHDFKRKAEKLKSEVNRIPALIKSYENIADELNKQLEQTKQKKSEAIGQLSGPVKNTLDNDTGWYESYVSQDGERRNAIEALVGKSDLIKERIEQAKDRADEVEEIIDNWKPSSDEDEEDDGPDLSELWGSVMDIWSRIRIPALSYTNGVKDPEKEKILEKLQNLVQNGLITLVLPEGKEVSNGVINGNSLPSLLYSKEQGEPEGLVDRILFEEYCGRFLTSFLSKEDKEVKYEMEYLIGGKDSDKENFGQTITDLLMIREGLNLVHILSDPEKREEANALAGLITGVTGLAPLTGIVTFFVMSIWAMGEAIVDIRRLLKGEKVAFLKTKETWKLSLDGLLDLGSQGTAVGEGSDENGMTYIGYLKLILFTFHNSLQYYRLMDVIQINLCKTDDKFRMAQCVYRAEIKGRGVSNHLFFGGLDPYFYMDVRSEKAY